MQATSYRPGEAELSEAVGKTEGIQPWRRVFHAASGTIIVLALTVLSVPALTATVILGALFALAVLLDAVRLFDPKVNTLFFRAFSRLASPREAQGLASSTWYILSALVVLHFFPTTYALAGILVLAWADPAASVVGQRWGRLKFLAGSVRGSAAFVAVAFLALIIFVPWPQALAAAVLTAIVEAAPLKLDDNLLVPVAVAASLFLMMG